MEGSTNTAVGHAHPEESLAAVATSREIASASASSIAAASEWASGARSSGCCGPPWRCGTRSSERCAESTASAASKRAVAALRDGGCGGGEAALPAGGRSGTDGGGAQSTRVRKSSISRTARTGTTGSSSFASQTRCGTPPRPRLEPSASGGGAVISDAGGGGRGGGASPAAAAEAASDGPSATRHARICSTTSASVRRRRVWASGASGAERRIACARPNITSRC